MASAVVLGTDRPTPLDLDSYPLLPRAHRISSSYVAFHSLAAPALGRLPDVSPDGPLRIVADRIHQFKQPRGRGSVLVTAAKLACFKGQEAVPAPEMFGLLEPDYNLVGDNHFSLLVMTPHGELIELVRADLKLFGTELQDRLHRLMTAASGVMTLTVPG